MTRGKHYKNALSAAASALVIVIANAAYAQDGGTTDNASDGTSFNEGGLSEIIVTAQKRAQNLQDVPAAISAFSADDLAQRGVSQTSARPNVRHHQPMTAGCS